MARAGAAESRHKDSNVLRAKCALCRSRVILAGPERSRLGLGARAATLCGASFLPSPHRPPRFRTGSPSQPLQGALDKSGLDDVNEKERPPCGGLSKVGSRFRSTQLVARDVHYAALAF
jgi:hypothetical protein